MVCSVCREEIVTEDRAMRYKDGRGVHVGCLDRIEPEYQQFRRDREAQRLRVARGFTRAELKKIRGK